MRLHYLVYSYQSLILMLRLCKKLKGQNFFVEVFLWIPIFFFWILIFSSIDFSVKLAIKFIPLNIEVLFRCITWFVTNLFNKIEMKYLFIFWEKIKIKIKGEWHKRETIYLPFHSSFLWTPKHTIYIYIYLF